MADNVIRFKKKITRQGGGLGVTIPLWLKKNNDMKWNVGDTVEFTWNPNLNQIIIKKVASTI